MVGTASLVRGPATFCTVLVVSPAILVLLASAPLAAASPALHTYDDLQDQQEVGSSYPGFVYSGGDTVLCDSLNSAGYPPSTPRCAIAPQWSGVVYIDAASTFFSFAADFATDYNTVAIQGFDASWNLVASTTCSSPYGANTHCGFAGSAMSHVVISGQAGFYTMDTAQFDLSTCFQYNPAALTNLCVTLEQTTTNVPTPYVGTNPLPVCIVGPVCVDVPVPYAGVGSTPVTAPMPQGYFEATVLCGLGVPCRVDLP